MPIKIKLGGLIDVNSVLKAQEAELLEKKKQEMREALVAATPVDTGEARDGWVVTETGIENNVDHISLLNKGSSQQAPAHFIEQAVLSVEGIRPDGEIVREK